MNKTLKMSLKDLSKLFSDLSDLEELVSGKPFADVVETLRKDYDIIRIEQDYLYGRISYFYMDVNYKSLCATIKSLPNGNAVISGEVDFYPDEQMECIRIYLDDTFEISSEHIN